MKGEPFRRCRICDVQWSDWREFILDPSIQVLGLQAVPAFPQANVLVFVHGGCGGSISTMTSRLQALLELAGPEQASGKERCDGCYRDLAELSACDRPCIIARDRRLTLLVVEAKRKGRLPGG